MADDLVPQITTFFSWQSDLDQAMHTRAIRRAIIDACGAVSEELSVSFENEEATRRLPGAPNIPAAILSKIDGSDIFIADVTAVAKINDSNKETPNPNVVFELGYAVSVLGWSRIILLFNRHSGSLNSLPFDYAQNRVSPFSMSSKNDMGGYSTLVKMLTEAIRTIVQTSPRKDYEVRGLDPDGVRRQRDVSLLRDIFCALNVQLIYHYYEVAPALIPDDVVFFWHDFETIMQSPSSHFNDKELERRLRLVYSAWEKALSYSEYYQSNRRDNYVMFKPNIGLEYEASEVQQSISKDVQALYDSVKEAVSYVKEAYLEIDIEELNKVGMKAHLEFMKKAWK